MATYILRRALYSIPVMLIATFLIFFFVSISGDPLGEIRVNPNVSEQTLQNIVERKHLDEPVHIRYVFWLQDVFTERFGSELLSDDPIWPDLVRVMGNTLQLILFAEVMAIMVSIGVGVYSAIRQYSPFDYAATTFSFVGFSTPIFWLALLLQIFAVWLYNTTGTRVFYVFGMSTPGIGGFVDRVQHLALPVFTLAFVSMAQYTRYMRSSMLEVVNSDYVRTARAKGLRERRVIMKHAFRNGLIPLTTVIALDFGALFGGAIVTESIFQIDGMGRYFINNLAERDLYPIMAWLVIVSVMIIVFNLLADIVYGWLDPRIRYD